MSGHRVYLDKFCSLPHLPIADGCNDPNEIRPDVTLSMRHTGIRTRLDPEPKRVVYPTGSLTNEYINNTRKAGRKTARGVMKAELALIRSRYERSEFMEEKLGELEERKEALRSVCEHQLSEESEFMKSFKDTSGGKSVKETRRKKPKSSIERLSKPRPNKKVFNEESLIRCILDTTEMSTCSSMTGRLDGDSITSTQSMKKIKNSGRWHPDALRLAHPELENDGDYGLDTTSLDEKYSG
mmetsp:Transcript_23993/g.35213  ORF Transcript_23993/g.35213 Transcript_23993/m.35213 type:complete len:240 (+) Transcript_23993:216-935(+)|eukprot:CAMPEP_0185026634 /NCGR_PEP_ID=MMETSP1103-20130426/10975_1 /TAXON_ID=36769 /ORGANISM="Paraphysomonas bandaiensis, Strain Caron Lab Isolate" /LENGTH=239 /DNA_ID=CAMNT_0027560283 /DNA_START=151 /DNA_END=870 /DNA_ORIENTATION=+